MARVLWHEDGQAGVEYGVVAVLVSIAAIGVMAVLGIQVQGLFQAFLDGLRVDARAGAPVRTPCASFVGVRTALEEDREQPKRHDTT